MENGYLHPFGVSPNLRVEIRRTGVGENIARIRNETRITAERLGLDEAACEYLRAKLNRLDAGAFYPVLSAGDSLESRLLGQVVPNRQEILKIGGKIFINDGSSLKTIGKNTEMALPYVTEYDRAMLEQFTNHETETALTSGHELFHPVGLTPEIQSALSAEISGAIDEAKATLGGILTICYADAATDLRNEVFANCLACAIRYCYKNRLNDPSYAFYVNENMAVLSTMRRAGLIEFTENGIKADWARVADGRWLDEVTVFIRRVITAYRDKNTEAIKTILNEYCSRDEPFIAELIKFVNK